MREVLRRLLAALGDAEVRRLTAERDEARRIRDRAVRAVVRWHAIARIEKARADALAATRTKESTT
ncbi:hypothetical protein [Micromonospora tarensis]|uniref:Uncharacterized protein n=1 Tax=Micromonospora tarensis TaxID=2806100 RepID=A0ABS1YCN6_9ACTN|nr:hypothetical protein [Micromonospora tarensis]MBM0275128.1 hypothetical protein [Micromonospora tarensis]